MIQRIAGLAAGACALATLLVGLYQQAPTVAVLQRVVGAWLVGYGVATVLGALTRIAMAGGGARPAARPTPRGTERADRDR